MKILQVNPVVLKVLQVNPLKLKLDMIKELQRTGDARRLLVFGIAACQFICGADMTCLRIVLPE